VDNPTKKSLKHLEILVRQFVNVQGEGAGAALSVKSHVVELKSGYVDQQVMAAGITACHLISWLVVC
jgi:hypothetical protein